MVYTKWNYKHLARSISPLVIVLHKWLFILQEALKDRSASQEVTGNTMTNTCSLQRAINFTENNVMIFRVITVIGHLEVCTCRNYSKYIIE